MSDPSKRRSGRWRWRVLIRKSSGLDEPGVYQQIGSASTLAEAEVLASEARKAGFPVIIERDAGRQSWFDELPRRS